MKKTTNNEILKAISNFSTSTDKRFNGIDGRLDGIDGRLDGIDGRLDGIDGRLDGIDGRLTKVEATMVTKDYLDDKLADLRGDLVVLTRKEDRKLCSLINILHKRKLISEKEVKQLFSAEPFPQIL